MSYAPNPLPSGQALEEYVSAELRRVAESLNTLENGLAFPIFHSEPGKPREGQLARADGTDWNPGAGAGFYERVGGVWSKL